MNVRSLFETRQKIESRIEDLIALLDLIDGDENLEPYLAGTYPDTEDREEENEHAGDIQDEPHDATDEGDDEPFLGWGNPRVGIGAVGKGWTQSDEPDPNQFNITAIRYDGSGHRIGRKLLRANLKAKRAAHAVDSGDSGRMR